MGITERLQIVATHNEPLNKHVIWLKGNVFRKWDGSGWEIIGGGGSGTTNYNELENKPSINGKPLIGNVNIEVVDSQVDLSNYYTKQDIDNKNFLTEHQSLEEYATKEWVENKGFVVEIPNIDLTDYATRQFVLDEITKAQLNGGEVDLTGYVTKLELQEVARLIPSIEGYATEMWVNNQGFIKDIPEDYAKKSDIPSLSGYATETFVTDKINEAQLGRDENEESIDLSIYATKEWVEDNYLSDIPTDYITEEELGNKGFALESDLSRYQESISDLDTIRQGASKGATALQSYTEQYRGTVIGVKVNNSTKNQVSGIVDIGNVVTGVKINSSTKNPSNGIVDLGTVLTSHQDISGKQDKLTVVNHGTSDTTFTMTPNVLHKWGTITSLTLTFPTSNASYVDEYKAVFTAGTNFSMAVPDTMKWVNGQIPSFTEGLQYELSVLDSRILICSF